ncbi:MAG: 2-C-methyl-D-erythritol 4-phosphate cytidylyltransferase [Cyanobacteria bacterium J06639_18]
MYLLIPAAGSGRRMGSDRNKLLLSLLEKPILAWTLLAAQKSTSISEIAVICQPHDREEIEMIVDDLKLAKAVKFIGGGSSRQESVCNGLQGLPDTAEKVLIHDGARCLITPELFDRCADSIRKIQGLIAAVPVKDTIKVVDENGIIQNTPKRSNLWAAQTPQGFDVKLLKECHQKALDNGWEVTDDAALFERCGLPVEIVPGEETNLKVTTPQDLAIAEFILRSR